MRRISLPSTEFNLAAPRAGPCARIALFSSPITKEFASRRARTSAALCHPPQPDQVNLHGADGTPVTVMVDPKIVPFLGLYPLPNAGLNPGTFGDTGTFNTTGLLNLSENFFVTRFDQTFSEKDSLSITYLYDNGPENDSGQSREHPEPFETPAANWRESRKHTSSLPLS